MTSLHTKLKELRELRERATSGEWSGLDEPCEIHALDYACGDGEPMHVAPMVRGQDNTDFIICAANNWLTLIACLEKAVSALDEIQYESCTTDDTMDDRLKLENRITKKAWKTLAEIAAMLEKD